MAISTTYGDRAVKVPNFYGAFDEHAKYTYTKAQEFRQEFPGDFYTKADGTQISNTEAAAQTPVSKWIKDWLAKNGG